MAENIVFVIGPQRSGSTWIYRLFACQKQGFYLDRLVKENYFFADKSAGNTGRMRRKFLNRLTGQGPLGAYVDVCSVYFGNAEYIERMLAAFPEAKFVYTFRDPEQRAASFERHRRSHEFTKWLNGRWIGQDLFETQARFDEGEEMLHRRIAPENLLRLEFSDLESDGGDSWTRQLSEFIGTEIAPVDLGVVNKGLRNPGSTHHVKAVLRRLAQMARLHLLVRRLVLLLTTRNRRYREQ